jgi:hypothetical protein
VSSVIPKPDNFISPPYRPQLYGYAQNKQYTKPVKDKKTKVVPFAYSIKRRAMTMHGGMDV